MTLSQILLSKAQREIAGPRTQSRFDYQSLCGLALIFQQHDADNDYALIFEFHDDLMLANHSSNPTSVRFFQVKTKSKGTWNVSDLVRQKKSKKIEISDDASEKNQSKIVNLPSIVGKMYDNINLFGESVAAVTLVSNAYCDFKSHKEFSFNECGSKEFTKILKAVQAEYSCATSEQVKLMGFKLSDLSLNDSLTHAKGMIHDFVISKIGDHPFGLSAAMTAMIAECRNRSRYTENVSSFDDLVRYKGISRANVQEWLDSISEAIRVPSWPEIVVQLHYGALDLAKLRNEWQKYCAIALNSGDEASRRIRAAIRSVSLETIPSESPLSVFVDFIFKSTEAIAREYMTPFSLHRLKVMIIYELQTQD